MNIRKFPTFYIILIESAIEPIKLLLKNKNFFKKFQQKKNRPLDRALLDVSIHNHLMQNLPDKNKRGRPDIIHNSLLVALGTRLNKEGYLRIYIHTRNNEIITFNPEVRIPRNYNRFIGLMEQLFEVKNVPPNSSHPLISITSQSLEELLHTLEPSIVILFSETGIPTNNNKLLKIFTENKKVTILIGGFPHGDISQNISRLSDMILSIYSESLDTLVVLSYVLHTAEQSLKISD